MNLKALYVFSNCTNENLTNSWDGDPEKIDRIVAFFGDTESYYSIGFDQSTANEHLFDYDAIIKLNVPENQVSSIFWKIAKDICTYINKIWPESFKWSINQLCWKTLEKDKYYSISIRFLVTPIKEVENKEIKPIGKNHLFTSGGKLYGGRNVFNANH